MTDSEIIEALASGELSLHCPCGVLRSMTRAFHRRTQIHDCVHHPRRSCGTCRAADRMLAGVEARLYVEAASGPFIVTRWETS